MANYENSSPWASTRIVNNLYLDLLTIRPIPAQYTYRPDLLAYDLYGSSKLWWVFTQRNMNILKDPVYDLVAGIEIFLPQGPALSRQLGA
jgi:hypothetical protein